MTIASSDTAAAEAAPEDEPATAKTGGVGHDLAELAKTVIYALLIALVLRIVLFQPFTIPSASMEPTLLEGDYIIVSKFAYGWSWDSLGIPFGQPAVHGRFLSRAPHRGDIVVFKLPRDGHTDYIKRLIGLPGDKIQVTHGVVSINGAPVQQVKLTPETVDSAFGEPRQVDRFRDTLGTHTFTSYSLDANGDVENTGVYTVPAGDYFMMGDNRDNSVDSRFPTDVGVGFVPSENLVGKADIILFSWKQGEFSLFKPWTLITAARWNRFFNLLN